MEREFAAQLAVVRPDLSAAYAAAVPGARAAVLGRLWRGLLHEPLPGVASARPDEGLVVLADGRRARGPERRLHDLGEVPAVLLDERPDEQPGGRPNGQPPGSPGGRPYARPADLLAALGLPGSGRLAEDLDNSVASLALSRANARPLAPRTPEDHEQGVVDGHPYHPCCRNRPGVSVAEQLAYMPEHRPVVALDLVAVPAADCLVSGPWPASLTDGERLLLPVHPWQSEHVLPDLGMRPYARGAIPARPLMSVRTLAPLDGGPHLKTAFSTRMTSAVRDISPGSIHDCVLLSDLLTGLSRRARGPRMIRYLAGAAATAKGEFSADVSVMLREPTRAFAGRATVLPVSAVTAATAAAAGGPDTWLAAFARIALPGVLRLLSLGVALEAHGQNLLVVLDGRGLPARLAYRDLADVRLSPARLARHGTEVPPVAARLLHDDPGVLHAKLFGSLIGTTFGSLIAGFSGGDDRLEGYMWRIVRDAAQEAFDELPCNPDVRADRSAFFAPRIAMKAHLLAQLEGAPSGDNWMKVPNPLRSATD
ncbi:IucA/IucC family protein [Nonomuraea sp. NPDC050783]|uniref:IucA/IucC family protein n=1 Tax=Nonomuraea sp. NPDC050783 TaxID=3154634 RepID=UPI003465A093